MGSENNILGIRDPWFSARRARGRVRLSRSTVTCLVVDLERGNRVFG